MRTLLILSAVAWTSTAAADPAADAATTYDASVQRYLSRERARREPLDAAATEAVLRERAGARSEALDPRSSTALTNLISAAVKTDLEDVEDVEAGVQIAPLALLGRRSLAARGWSITVASLQESRFRVGTAYRYALDDLGVGPTDIGLKECWKDLDELAGELAAQRQDFIDVCAVVAAFPVPSDVDARDVWLAAAGACALPPPAGLNPAEAIDHTAGVDAEVYAKLAVASAFMASVAPTAPPELLPQVTAAQPATERLDALLKPLVGRSACIDDDEVAAALTRAKWLKRERAFGVGVTADFFPIIRGFDVDPDTQDPDGELAHTRLQGEFRWSDPRATWAIGVAATASREAAGDDLGWAASGTASVGYVVARLDGQPLTEDGQIALDDDGELPPTFSVGLDLAATVPLDPPDTQEELHGLFAVDALSITAYADLRFTKSLAVRLGIPINGEAATRESDQRRGLVWTVPVSVTTVVKL